MPLLNRRNMMTKVDAWDYECYPETTDEEGYGDIRCKWIPVKRGDRFIIAYNAGVKRGYIYDGRSHVSFPTGGCIGCGIEYLGEVWGGMFPIPQAKKDLETEVLEAKVDGYVIIGSYAFKNLGGYICKDGEYTKEVGDRPYCKYIKFKFV